ncbi:MAG: type II toxin-antitoxin system RelE/ParE family toxin [Bacteroidia bacterium]
MMASYKLIVTEAAILQLEESCLFYEDKKKGLGFEFEQEIADVLEIIEDNPFLFPVKFAHLHEAVVRRFPFVIVYEITEKQIVVVSIFHTKQNPSKKKKKK